MKSFSKPPFRSSNHFILEQELPSICLWENSQTFDQIITPEFWVYIVSHGKITSIHVIPHNITVQANEIAQAIRKVWELIHTIGVNFRKHKSVKI